MEEIWNHLIVKLTNRGLLPIEIKRIIKDAFNILGEERGLSLIAIDQKLQVLGWRKHIIDEPCFGLVTYLYENGDARNLAGFTFH